MLIRPNKSTIGGHRWPAVILRLLTHSTVQVQTAYKHYFRRQETSREDISQSSAFTDLNAIPPGNMQLQFKLILEAYGFKPTNVPPGLVLPPMRPWHLAY